MPTRSRGKLGFYLLFRFYIRSKTRPPSLLISPYTYIETQPVSVSAPHRMLNYISL